MKKTIKEKINDQYAKLRWLLQEGSTEENLKNIELIKNRLNNLKKEILEDYE